MDELEKEINNMVKEVARVAVLEIDVDKIIGVKLPRQFSRSFFRSIIREELSKIKESYMKQTPILVKRSKQDITEDKYVKKVLQFDFFYQNRLNNNIKEDLIEYYMKIGNALEIIGESEKDFWGVIKEQHDNGIKVLDIFYSRGEIYTRYVNDLDVELSVNNSISLEYTDEAVRTFDVSEKKVLERNKDRLNTV